LDRDSLISQAMEHASDNAEKWDGNIRGEHGKRYLATVRWVSNYRTIRTVVMLQDEQGADAQRAVQRWRYETNAILVFILLACLCWHFTRKMIQPIKEAHEQQNQFVRSPQTLCKPPKQCRINIWELNRRQKEAKEIVIEPGEQCLKPYECWYYGYSHGGKQTEERGDNCCHFKLSEAISRRSRQISS